MAITTDALKNTLASTYVAQCTHAAGHTASPGTTGANEMSGTGYARGAISWGSPSGGVVTGTATITIPNAGATLDQVGMFSAATAGTFRDSADVTNIVYPGAGTAVVTITYTQT